ncbi:oxidoreductase-like domain-containing protein 1 [Drosophila nasuta]|uniref:oxidoreductase-like domain-containing protein 1 n=1 Tax=Drosophila nasuta TaxID=42062 RepID=UPI00295F4D5A|nr:oxidoreductase-like domain-containing protein 1 [Drosophila nasuta]
MPAPLCFRSARCLLLGRLGSVFPLRQLADKGSDIVIPPEPTTCCMSGCANCVWIEYAETLSKLLGDNDERAREIVLSKIQDPNLKMFLMVELQNMKRLREQKATAAKEQPKETPK